MQSHTIEIRPTDSRCRYWAKVVRSDSSLPQPVTCSSAHDVPGSFLRNGEEELLPGDVLFEGEANHHRRTDRGWTYNLHVVSPNGLLLHAASGGFGELRKKLKAGGMSPELLAGSGDVAAMVRIAHGVRDGTLQVVPAASNEEEFGDPEA